MQMQSEKGERRWVYIRKERGARRAAWVLATEMKREEGEEQKARASCRIQTRLGCVIVMRSCPPIQAAVLCSLCMGMGMGCDGRALVCLLLLLSFAVAGLTCSYSLLFFSQANRGGYIERNGPTV